MSTLETIKRKVACLLALTFFLGWLAGAFLYLRGGNFTAAVGAFAVPPIAAMHAFGLI